MTRISEGARVPLPTGTVTFLLTDVESSSRTWEQDEEAVVAKAVARMYEILDETIAAHGGVRPVEQGEGDSVVAAFARASDAVAAAVDGQLRLQAEAWPTTEPVRVRMALHSGEARLRDGDNYVGPALNRCARLRELAHGGQILVSGATHELVADQLPDDITLTDLGSHRLRDLGRPEHVYQLGHPDLVDESRPLRSLAAHSNNLPFQLTPFIGREQEMGFVRELTSRQRLITLTGSGGCGKTRLALQVAVEVLDTFPDGVWWIDLAALADPDLVPHALGAVMGIREAPGEPFTAVLERVLAGRRALILLDNCEHLIDACAGLCHALLRSCQDLVVMTTSREPLGVEGETTWRVPSLTVPEPDRTERTESEAVRLFVDRAVRARPTFELTEENAEVVAQVCRRLDGIPLAIELAAARIRALTAEQIAEGLDDRFRLLSGGARTAMPRQRTLEASVDWSYDLLDEAQRTLFRRLSVFAGSFALEGAEAVCPADGLEAHQVFDLLLQLVDRSLVQVDDVQDHRYRLLETIRQYGRHKLVDAGEADAVRARHLEHYTELAEHAGPLVECGATRQWLERLDLELDNLRAAMDWASTSGRAKTGLRLAIACPLYWVMRGRFKEARERIDGLVEVAAPDTSLEARAVVALQGIALYGTDLGGAVQHGRRALELARDVGDVTLEARALAFTGAALNFADPAAAADPLSEGLAAAQRAGDMFCMNVARYSTGGVRHQLGDLPSASRILDDAVEGAHASGDLFNLLGSLQWRGSNHMVGGRLPAAERDLREGLAVATEVGDQLWGRMTTEVLGLVVSLRGDEQRARALIDEGLRDAEDTGNLFAFVIGMVCLAGVERGAGNVDATAEAAEKAASVWRSMGSRTWLTPSLAFLAWATMQRGDVDRAAALLEEAIEDASGLPTVGWALMAQAWLARHVGDADAVAERSRRCLMETGPDYITTAPALEALAGAMVLLGEPEDAGRLFGAADVLRARTDFVRWPADEPGYQADVARAREALGDDAFGTAWEEGATMSAEEAVGYATRGHGRRKRASKGWESLTRAELQVVELVAEGLTNPQIAERLFVSPRTVQSHLRSIFAKLGVSTRAELATEATRRDLSANGPVGA